MITIEQADAVVYKALCEHYWSGVVPIPDGFKQIRQCVRDELRLLSNASGEDLSNRVRDLETTILTHVALPLPSAR